MTVVLTRPTPDSDALADDLTAHGIDSLVAPMLSIVARDAGDLETDLELAQAVLITSANGVRALADTTQRRDLSLFVVGDATAAAARTTDFARIESADGDFAALAALVGDRLKPDAGPLLHISGDHVAGDLAGALSERGFEYQQCVLYDAIAAEALPDPVVEALKDGTVDGVLLFSPRSARIFVDLARQSDLANTLKQITAYCLSDAVAAAAEPELWRHSVVGARPRNDSLIERVAADLANRDQEPEPQPIPETVARLIPDTGNAAPSRSWPTITLSVVASAVVAVIVVVVLSLMTNQTDTAAVPVDLEARLKSLDMRGRDLADRLNALEARDSNLDALIERVDAAETRMATADGATDADLTREIKTARSDLERELAQLAQAYRADVSALSNTVAALSERVDFANAEDTGATGTLLLAVGQLRAAAAGSGPFVGELGALRSVAAGDPVFRAPLAALAPYANGGIATDAMVRAEFQNAALAILRAEALPEDAGWLDTAFAEVKGLVTVRRVGEDVEGDDPQARLARAEARLARDDLAGAIALVEAVDSAAAGDWLSAARGRHAVSTALDALSSAALVRAGTATTEP